jgi:hypothetical protein
MEAPMPSRPLVYTCAAHAAVQLWVHAQPERDCQPRVEVCPASDAMNLPDAPERDGGPGTVVASSLTAAAFTGSVSVPMWAPSFWSTKV